MKLLIVTHEYPPQKGGAGVGVRNLAAAAALGGHQVAVITAGREHSITTEQGVRVRRLACGAGAGKLAGLGLWLRFMLAASAAVREAVVELAPEVVASFFPVVAGFSVARAGCAVPHATAFVGADAHDPTRPWLAADRNPLVRHLTRRAVNHAAAISAGSRDMVRRIEALFPGRQVHRVPFGVRLPEPPPAGSAPHPPSPGSITVTTACRLVRRKRIDLLLEAVAMAGDDRLRVVVIGDGPALPALRRQAQQLGLARQVSFTGWVSEAEKAALLAAADIFCQPSEHEALGLAIIEAMSLGTAVVTTDTGGQADIVRDGIDGHLIPTRDPQSLARCLLRLRDEPERLVMLQRAARERARQFTPERAAEAFLDVYRQITVPPGESR